MVSVSRTEFFVAIAIGWLAISTALCQSPETTTSPAAQSYLKHALNIMQSNALNKKSIDWVALRRAVYQKAEGARTAADTYPAIAYGLSQLGEKHSGLQLPDGMPAEQKQALYAAIRRELARPAPARKASPFANSREISGHIEERNRRRFAYVYIPTCGGPYTEMQKNLGYFHEYADKLHALVVGLEAQKPDGWIVDLRGNGGGNMYPMLAGIGAVLGEGDLGMFISGDGGRERWFYSRGKAGVAGHAQEAVSRPPFVFTPLPPVAVLFDRGTMSAAEAVAISFVGRPRQRSFGESTGGYSTANEVFPLPDGAALVLCTGMEGDRNGHVYPYGLEPDVKVDQPETIAIQDRDATVLAALEWLSQQN